MINKIGIIGGGNLGTAIAEGLIQSGFISPGHILITRRSVDQLHGQRILVVDDNASARRAVALIAQSCGMRVDQAHDGPSALATLAQAQAEKERIDLVLIDWKMPDMDGIECIRRLQGGRSEAVPIIMMASAFRIDEAVQAAKAGQVTLSSVIAKPVTPSALREAIGIALGRLAPAATMQRVPAGPEAGTRHVLAGARLLLAEDNALNQELTVALLGEVGIEVVTAHNGQEALDALRRDGHFDGVLMDCQMPVMDGYTAAREIRKQAAWAELPVIAMTANVMAGDRERILAAGMNDHIAKPLSVERMFETLTKWIRPRSPRPADSADTAPANRETPAIDSRLQLPGIDREAGLRACGRNARLHQQVLTVFLRQQRDFAQRFAEARQDPDPSVATRVAHTLRGSAGSIGALAVEAAAAALEELCSSGATAEAVDTKLAELMDRLTLVLQGLSDNAAAKH